MSLTIERFEGDEVTAEMISAAAKLFSGNYGVWGPLAVEKMGVSSVRKGEFNVHCEVLKNREWGGLLLKENDLVEENVPP